MIGGKGLQIESRYWLLWRFCTSYQTRHQVSNNYSYNFKKKIENLLNIYEVILS